MSRLAIIATHPIQYYAPWFAYLEKHSDLSIRVFYLWNPEATNSVDPEFEQRIVWDIPLLEGYRYELLENRSRFPGTHHFLGINTPSLGPRVRAFRPDAVLLTTYNYFGVLSFILGRQTRVPMLFRGDSHRLLPRTGAKEWVRQKLIASVFSRFSAALYVGNSNREYFRIHGVPDRRLFFSPHAIDNARFSLSIDKKAEVRKRLKAQFGIPDNHIVVQFVGKLVRRKGLHDLLGAFKAAELHDTTLLIVGDGELESEVIAASGNSSRIRHLPFQNQAIMPEILAIGDLLVLPSYIESWGLIVNEAMAAGQAILVSDWVGCQRDLVHPEINGLVFTVGNTEDLKRCLTQACADRVRLEAWGRQSKEIIAAYSYENASKGLLEALEYLRIPLTSKPTAPPGRRGSL